MCKSFIKLQNFRKLLASRRLETGFSMLEAVVVVGVLLALAVSGFFAYGPITENAKKAKVKSTASTVHTAVIASTFDGDPNTEPKKVIEAWNASTDKIRVDILAPSSGAASANGDICVQATNVQSPYIVALEGSCDSIFSASAADVDGDGNPNYSDPDIDGDGIPNIDDSTPYGTGGGVTPPSGGGGGGVTPPSGGGSGVYTSTGVVPVGYTYGANFGACPASFADALQAKVLADGSQTYFNANYLYSIGDNAGSNAAWSDYNVLSAVYSDKYSAMTSSQQKTMDNFSSYVNDVPGYTDLNNTFWNTPNQPDFNLMNEKMVSAIPAFCGAVTANTATLKCHAETKNYIDLSNAYYHNYMYENQRYSVDPTQANYDSWNAALRAQDPKLDGSGQVYKDDAAKQAAYDAMIAVVGGEWEVTNAQNMHRAELDASYATFQADTSRGNFDVWTDYEYPVNACR